LIIDLKTLQRINLNVFDIEIRINQNILLLQKLHQRLHLRIIRLQNQDNKEQLREPCKLLSNAVSQIMLYALLSE